MNRLLSTFAITLVLCLGVSQANAALLTDWTYELEDVVISNHNTNLPNYQADAEGGLSWHGGKYSSGISPNSPQTPTGYFNFTETEDVFSLYPEEVLNHSTEVNPYNENFGFQQLADLTFNYLVYSDDLEVYFDISYTIPLYTYYDAATENEYIYYNKNSVSTQGSTAITYQEYSYGVTGVGLYVDDRALVSLQLGTETYSGWLINEETRTNMYSQYIIGEDNSDYYLGKKTEVGLFDIDGVFSVTHTLNSPPPSPTPEPATMLLTGLGLAGIGAIKRRRNKK